jgi:two-component system, LytTR family, sensor kinase
MSPLKFTIPKYTTKDIPIMVGTMLPQSLLTNYFLFGKKYFADPSLFIWSTLLTFSLISLAFILYGGIALTFRKRFPHDSQTRKRLFIVIPLFILISGVYLTIIFRGYDWFGFFNYRFNLKSFNKIYLSFAIINIFLTLLNEGVYRFEKYRTLITETEQLKKEYLQSRLLGLKSQLNPHFLFNSLNTLSCLINENCPEAEVFLDEMSKVYRYQLRAHDDQLICLGSEIRFIKSYSYILKKRYCDAFQLTLDISEHYADFLLPPLTLQMIVENSVNNNTIGKSIPLQIEIKTGQDGFLYITNNLQKKQGTKQETTGLENIRNKYKLLSGQEITIIENKTERTIALPLLSQQKEMIA